MIIQLLFFLLSAAFSLGILYVLGMIWFGDKHTQIVRSFFVLGVITACWIACNAILSAAGAHSFPVTLSLGMIFVCALPFSLLRFSLHYTKSPLAHSRLLLVLTVLLPAADIALMLSSPMHRLYFADYAFPIPAKGIFYTIHMLVALTAVFLAFLRIIVHAFSTRSYRAFRLLAGLGILVSTILHMTYALTPTIRYDLSSVGFFLTFLLFAFSAHRSHIFRFRRMAIERMFHSLDDIIFIFDDEGTVIEQNAAAEHFFPLFAHGREEVTAAQIITALRGRVYRSTPENLLTALTESTGDCAGKIRLLSADGRAKTYALHWHILLRKSTPAGCVLSLSDTSDYHDMIDEINSKNESLLRLNEEATSASKAKSAFLANMSHEIRTPLNAIIGMAHIAGESLGDHTKTAAAVSQITRASKHLLELLNNILDISKIESGKFTLSEEPFSPEAALGDVLDIFTQRCAEQNLTLLTELAGLATPVRGDALRLKQVIINLLGNAVKFTEPGGTVHLRASGSSTGGQLVLAVRISDTGIGMTPAQVSRLFTAFEQADSSIAARYGGTGIGLALSQHLVGLMGSAITVESAIGQGSTFSFTLTLPLHTQDCDLPPEHTSGPVDLHGKRVLVVDDVDINRFIASEFLAQTGAVVEEAADGAEALRLFWASPAYYYDLILMDVQMPNMNGHEATRQIRATPRPDAATLPVVAMTANAYREDVEKALASGMTAHLSKPLEIDVFHSLLAQVMAG